MSLIAEFMGGQLVLGYPIIFPGGVLPNRICEPYKLQFDSSWDWLMPVVEKIERMENVSVIIKRSRCRILVGKKVFSCHTIVKLNSMYRVVVEFIKWNNAIKQTA